MPLIHKDFQDSQALPCPQICPQFSGTLWFDCPDLPSRFSLTPSRQCQRGAENCARSSATHLLSRRFVASNQSFSYRLRSSASQLGGLAAAHRHFDEAQLGDDLFGGSLRCIVVDLATHCDSRLEPAGCHYGALYGRPSGSTRILECVGSEVYVCRWLENPLETRYRYVAIFIRLLGHDLQNV